MGILFPHKCEKAYSVHRIWLAVGLGTAFVIAEVLDLVAVALAVASNLVRVQDSAQETSPAKLLIKIYQVLCIKINRTEDLSFYRIELNFTSCWKPSVLIFDHRF